MQLSVGHPQIPRKAQGVMLVDAMPARIGRRLQAPGDRERMPAGVAGTGDLTKCMHDVHSVLTGRKAGCRYSKCMMDGVPNLGFVGTLVATENFARVIQALSLQRQVTINVLERKGATLCSLPWHQAQEVRRRAFQPFCASYSLYDRHCVAVACSKGGGWRTDHHMPCARS